MRNSKYMKKSTVDRVIERSTPDTDHISWPRSVSEKSWLNQIGAELPNSKKSGRKIPFGRFRDRLEKRRPLRVSGVSGGLKVRAGRYGTAVVPHGDHLI